MSKNYLRLSAISFAIASTLSSNAALASEDNSVEENVERIEITGSRILREGAIAPSPVTVLTGDQLMSTGALNIGEALNELPALASTYNMGNSGRYIGTAGLNILDLRGMGASRTLVLVDGKRHVSSSAGDSSVDTNTIPTAWIDRVEVITGGASAVYGADAVTGVVNFILKKSIEGFKASATAGAAESSDYTNRKFEVSYGTNFADDQGNVAVSFEYNGQSKLDALDNPWTSTSHRSLPNWDQTADQSNDPNHPDMIYTPDAGYYAINESGVFSSSPMWWTGLTNSFNEDGTLRPLDIGDNFTDTECANCDYMNLMKFVELQPEFDRINVNVKSNYAINDDHSVYAEAKYVNTQSTTNGQPSFFFFDTRNVITRNNAFLTDDVAQLMDDNGLGALVINRFNTDLGQRVEESDRTTTRFVVGAEGYVFDDWKYDASIVYGQTKNDRLNINNLVMANYFNAIDAVEDADGNIVCADADARDAGCVPLNIMGYGHATQEVLDYVNTDLLGTSTIKQTVASASVSNGALFEMPAGDVGFAAGIEYRKEQSEIEEPDNAAETFFNALGEDKGQYDVKEAFVEFSIPVLFDHQFAEELTIDAAARVANYSTTGTATSWKLGADWMLNDELRFRATKSAAIRAPNIAEVFGAESQTFFSIDDPCKSSELAMLEDSANRAANCAALGVAADFDSSYDSASVSGTISGNKDVDSEKSDSLTIGAVYQPGFVDDLVITVDYWDIELSDAISTISAQTILERCVDSTSGIDNQYCNLITRDADSEITNIQNSVLNVGGQRARGIDFEVGHTADIYGGTLNTTLLGTYMLERKIYPFQKDKSNYSDILGTSGDAEFQANLKVSYSKDAYFGTLSTRYIDSVSLYTDQQLELNANPNSLMGYDSYMVSDISAGYTFSNGIKATFGIDNVFNQPLPYGAFGTSAGSGEYDNIGRFYYTNISIAFD